MTNSNFSQSAIFSVEGSLVDLTSQQVPNFNRASQVNLERMVDDSLQLYPVGAYYPAFSSEDGSFLLEPASVNLITWNMDLSQPVWLRGSNVRLRVDYANVGEVAPDGTPTSDRVLWDTGTGQSQILRRHFELEAANSYTLWVILRLRGGLFGANDVIRFAAGTVGGMTIPLSDLNDHPNRYILLERTFTASGRQPVLPGNLHQISDYAISSVSANTLTVAIPAGYSVSLNDWEGGQLEVGGNRYQVASNTVMSNGMIVVTTQTSNLLSNGVTTAMRAAIQSAPPVQATLEFYAENTVSIDWGGIFLEPLPFRTSAIYQSAFVEPRAAATLSYRHSPIANLKSFAIFGTLKDWRGNGNLLDFGNLSLEIFNGRLRLTADNNIVNLGYELQQGYQKFLIQVQEATNLLTFYVNGVLQAKTTLNNFRGSTESGLILTSDGVRCWQRLWVSDRTLLEGQIEIGEAAKAQAAEIFATETLIDATTISSHAPLINLPSVTVPAPPAPLAQSTITSVNTSSNVIGVVNAANFAVGLPVVIVRNRIVIVRSHITAVSGLNITVAASYGAVIGDSLIAGQIDVPGIASVRFPFDAIDPQIITAIDTANRRITVDSTLSFTRSRAFVRTALYQDVAEVLVRDINNTSSFLFLDKIEGIQVGDTISQPLNELFIDPENYFASILDPIPGVTIHAELGKFTNGMRIENTNAFPVIVNPAARVYL